MIAIAQGPTLPAAVDVIVYPTEEAWREARGDGPGSSDAAAILGASTKRGRWDVYAERVLGRRNTINAKLARRGHREEARILEDYAEATGHS
ncbi:MAG: YqaJ viral recombinase family protein, partial [Phycisphaerales bacterium]|nr:YqaJ viral recombinase family protein [Phycisphaerales bacterium]